MVVPAYSPLVVVVAVVEVHYLEEEEEVAERKSHLGEVGVVA